MILFTELSQLMHQLKTLDFVKGYLMHVDHKETLLDVHDIFPFVPLPFPSTKIEKHIYCKTKDGMKFIKQEKFFCFIDYLMNEELMVVD